MAELTAEHKEQIRKYLVKWVAGLVAIVGLSTIASVFVAGARGVQSATEAIARNPASVAEKLLARPEFVQAVSGFIPTPPIGSVIGYTGSIVAPVEIPDGWLPCDGRGLARSNYTDLFKVIGTWYGDGLGEFGKDFNLPDYRGLFLRGVDDPDGPVGLPAANRDLQAGLRQHPRTGATVGGVVGSVQDDQLQSHLHLDEGHSHQLKTPKRVAKDDDQADDKKSIWSVDHQRTYRTTTGKARLSDPEKSSHGIVRHGPETRPKNISVVWIIRVR
ncbi:MAG: phage tail protein [Gammaproteobacteria bacterium]|nr:phage tail protein [Gammaproteobacteria bacterium]